MRELQPTQYLSKAEVHALCNTVEDRALVDKARGRKVWPRIWMMVHLALETGLRVSELANLQVKDLRLKGEPSVHVSHGKGGKARDVLISDNLRKHLKKHIQANRLRPEDYVLNVNRRQYSTMGLQQQFKRAAKAAGLSPTYSIHSLRHTFGTYLYEKEKDLRMVQQQLGHSDARTSAIYAGVAKERVYNAVNGLYS
jgi:site-specific recombinase XerD